MEGERLFDDMPEKPMTEEKRDALKRSGKSKKRDRAGWRNLDYEPGPSRIGVYRFWAEPPRTGGIAMRVMEYWCANETCGIGPVNMVQKLLDRPYPREGQEWKCPACQEPMKFMWNVSEDDYREQAKTLFEITDVFEPEGL